MNANGVSNASAAKAAGSDANLTNSPTAIPVKTLGFSNSLYNDESGNFIKEIYNSNYGLTSTTKAEDGTVNKNYDFGFDIDS